MNPEDINNRIIRSICFFTDKTNPEWFEKIAATNNRLPKYFENIQTKRIVSPSYSFLELDRSIPSEYRISKGSLSFAEIQKQYNEFINSRRVNFNIDLSNENLTQQHVDLLFNIIRDKPASTFNFAYTFNNPDSSPFFPSAKYEKNGFSIGLQTTDLSENCTNLQQWFDSMQKAWQVVYELFKNDPEFLGIDSSIAPLFAGKSSLINFVHRLGYTFNQSVLSDIYTQMTHFIKNHNPKPVGLCGLMVPCLEDSELTQEYEKGNFDIKTNLFLSLHSGLGIDTYPIGIDEDPEAVLNVLKLTQALSRKYTKPLSIRFVSDGKAKINEKTDFQNQYLRDVAIRPLISA